MARAGCSYDQLFRRPTAARADTCGDLNGDLLADVVTSNLGPIGTANGGEVAVLLQNTFGLAAPDIYPIANSILRSCAVADFNGDAIPDVVAANEVAGSVIILRGMPVVSLCTY
jgi:isocitrate dehydrogenase